MGLFNCGIFTLLLVGLSTLFIQAFECPSDGNHPNPEDCGSFYTCSNGIPSLFNCSKPLHYNPKIDACDWPQNVDCTVDPGPSSPPPEPTFDCAGRPNGLYPNPEECETFYKCSNGYTYLYDCPANLVYNPAIFECDYRYNVPSCGGATTTTVTTQTPSTTTTPPTTTSTSSASTPGEPEEFDCEGRPNGLYPNPTDCRTFYKCSNGYMYKYNCPGNLHFHPVHLECRQQSEVPYCGGRPTEVPTETPTEVPTEQPTQGPSTTEDPGEFSCDGKPCGDYPHESNCTLFYKCSEGKPRLIQCPATLAFNPVLQVCDLEENVPSCRSTPSTTEETTQAPTTEPVFESTTESAPESTTEPAPESTTEPAPESTTEPAPESTAEPAPESTTEPAPESTTEPAPESTTEESESTTSGSGEFTCNGRPDGLYPNPADCTTFYKCSAGTAYLYDCSSNLLFHRVLLECVHPEDALCETGLKESLVLIF